LSITVSKQFLSDFKKVCEFYECPPDEIELMKEAARNDIENAKECFRCLAKEIS